MVGWIVGILMVLAGAIVSLFIAQNELHFQALQMIVAVVLFALIVSLVAFWPAVKKMLTRNKK